MLSKLRASAFSCSTIPTTAANYNGCYNNPPIADGPVADEPDSDHSSDSWEKVDRILGPLSCLSHAMAPIRAADCSGLPESSRFGTRPTVRIGDEPTKSAQLVVGAEMREPNLWESVESGRIQQKYWKIKHFSA